MFISEPNPVLAPTLRQSASDTALESDRSFTRYERLEG